MSDRVDIHYLRPPGRLQVFSQPVIHDDPDVIVTLSRAVSLAVPMEIEGKTVLEDGSDIVWFTFPGAWHDIGRFHNESGVFTGLYANIITPVEMLPGRRTWHTTDLFLDVWLAPGEAPVLVDEDEFDEARASGALDSMQARRARTEAADILEKVRKGMWPPGVVRDWTRERALARL